MRYAIAIVCLMMVTVAARAGEPTSRPSYGSPVEILKAIPADMMPVGSQDTEVKRDLREKWVKENVPGSTVTAKGRISFVGVQDRTIGIVVSASKAPFGKDSARWNVSFTLPRTPETEARFKNARAGDSISLTGRLTAFKAYYHEVRRIDPRHDQVPGEWSLSGTTATVAAAAAGPKRSS